MFSTIYVLRRLVLLIFLLGAQRLVELRPATTLSCAVDHIDFHERR